MKAVIFDLDGTMVDNMMVHYRVWQQVLKDLDLDIPVHEVKEKVHGIDAVVFERIFPGRFSDIEKEKLGHKKEALYREVFRDDLRLVDGLPNLLEEIELPMAIGSAAPPENVDFVLDGLGIRHYFNVVLHSDDVINGKPDPEIYLKISSILGVNANECIVFEDSIIGAKAASSAGCKVVIILTTQEKDDFEGIPNILSFHKDFTTVLTKELL